jgi:hypothetical protein
VSFEGAWLTVGGMLDGQQVSNEVFSYEID